MPIGNSYPRDVIIEDADLFLGTKASVNNTVNYTAQGIANYLNINGKVSISGQMVFKFVEGNGFDGTISFDGGGGNNTPFSSITQLMVSIMDMSGQEVNVFLAYLTGKEILLARQNKINSFGNYKITGYTVTIDPDFYTLDLEYIGGNGNILIGKYYDLVAFSSSAGGTPYVLPTASSTILGGVKIGDGINIAINGEISATTTSDVISDVIAGAINVGDTVNANTNLQGFVEQILYKTYYPTLFPPTFSLSNNAGVREIGSSSSFNLIFNFNRGDILGNTVLGVWQPASSQGDRAGTSINYTINGITQSSNILSISPTLLEGGNPFNGSVTYGIGIQPLDSKGGNFDFPFPAGTSASQSTTIQGIYPYFWYKSSSPITDVIMQSAIAAGTATKVVGISTGTITIPFAANGEYIAVAYPSTSTTKTLWYVTALDNQSIPGGTLGAFTTKSCTTSLWSSISYKIHVSPAPITMTAPNTSAQLRNS